MNTSLDGFSIFIGGSLLEIRLGGGRDNEYSRKFRIAASIGYAAALATTEPYLEDWHKISAIDDWKGNLTIYTKSEFSSDHLISIFFQAWHMQGEDNVEVVVGDYR